MSDDYVDGGTLPITPEGTFPIPREFRQHTTMRTWAKTVVFHKDATTTYPESDHPELHPAEREFYVEFSPHGLDEVTRFRAEPAEVMAERMFADEDPRYGDDEPEDGQATLP